MADLLLIFEQNTLALRCPHCGAAGAATWRVPGAHAKGLERELQQISGEFHVETGRTAPDKPLIVCNACDTIQQD